MSGAANSTAKQMRRLLGLKRLRKQKAHLAYSALSSSLTQTGNVTLNVANAVFVNPNLAIEQSYSRSLQLLYKAE